MPFEKGKPNPGKKFVKGECGNPNGRPRNYLTLMHEKGYTSPEILTTLNTIITLTVPELKKLWQNEAATGLEKIICGAVIADMKKGTLDNLMKILERLYGKAKESTTITGDSKIEVVFTRGKTIL